MALKYLRLFEDSQEDRDQNILEILIMLERTGISKLSDLDFKESEDGYDILLISDLGNVGFVFEEEEVDEYTGEGWYDLSAYYTRELGGKTYVLVCNAQGRGREWDEVESVGVSSINSLYSK